MHNQVLSVHCGTVREFLCTTLSGEERQSNLILQTLHTELGAAAEGHKAMVDEKEGFRVIGWKGVQ